MFKIHKKIFNFLFIFTFIFSIYAISNENKFTKPDLLSIFEKSYPDVQFISEYDNEILDWKITLIVEGRKNQFYWNKGSFLPLNEISNKEKYWSLLYNYDYKIPLRNPDDFSKEEIGRLKKFGSNENRKNGSGTPMYFFDAIYDSFSRGELEKHITKIDFLGFKVNIHKRIITPLKNVENKIYEFAKSDEKIQQFINELNKNEGYFWRQIANTNRKSFHSLGIAIDLQPKSYRGKQVYWSWAKEQNPENWMLTPLKNRWMPPQKVIDAFEEEGFIWGGKWAIWDNMHFEYHPELINFAKENQKKSFE